jgi:PAS domain S-box-containing protein
MINVVVIFDFIFFLASAVGLVLLFKGWKRTFRSDTRLLLSGLLIFAMAYGFCLAVEWSGISTALDTLEDFIGALLPMWWAFVLYALSHEISRCDLVESKEKLRRVIDNIVGSFIYRHNPEGKFVYVSRSIEKVLGYSREEFTGCFTDYLTDHPLNEKVLEYTAGSIAGVQQPAYEVQIYHKDGTPHWLEVTEVPVRDESGTVIAVEGIAHDITERKQAEEVHSRLTAILEATSDLVSTATLDAQLTYINQAGRYLLGWTDQADITQRRISDVHPDWALRIIQDEGVPIAMEKGLWGGETAILGAEGDEIPVSQVIMSHRSPDGNVEYLSTIMRNISEDKRAEEALRESENQFRTLFESANDAIFIMDDKVFLECNPETLKMFRCDRQDIVGHSPVEFSPSEQPDGRLSTEKAREKLDLAFAGEPQRFEWTHTRKDGSAFCTEVSLNRLDMPDKPCLQAIVRNIDDRKQAEEALRISEEKLSKAFRSSPNIMAIFDMVSGRRLEVGGTFSDITGYSHEELVGTKIGELGLFIDKEKVSEALQALNEEGSVHDIELRIRTKAGQERTIRYSGEAFETEGRKLAIVVGEDITDRKKAEAEREQLLKTLAAKNEELESILYVSTHDLKSPIVNIQGFSAELGELCRELDANLKKKKTPMVDKKISSIVSEDIPESLGFIQGGSVKIKSLLDGLLKVSRISAKEVNIEALDMNKLLQKVRRNMAYEIKQKSVSLTVKKLPACRGDAVGIDQVFTNLIENALKYPDPNRKGSIIITGRVEGDMSVYCVQDNGIGISPDHQHKIFELFHRLDPNDGIEGEGLGLTIVRRILQRQNGDICVESEPGEGSRFHVSLPTCPQRVFA